jgi:hypothetical protein
MNKPDQPRKAINPTGKRPRTIRQQLEHDAWTNHCRLATRMAGRTARRPREPAAGVIEPGPARNRRSLSRQDRTLLAASLVLVLLLLFARASMAQGQPLAAAGAHELARDSTFGRAAAHVQGIELSGIEFRGDDAPQFSVALDTDIKAEITGMVDRIDVRQRFRNSGHAWSEAIYRFPLPTGAMEMHPILGGYDLYLADPDTSTDREFQLDWKPDFGPDTETGLMHREKPGSLLSVDSSVNLARFSSTATGWKAQLGYSLATLLSAASLLWFSTPSRRVQAGGSPPPPVRAH